MSALAFSVEERIEFLKEQKKTQLDQTKNIDDVIHYYNTGGKIPVPGEIVYALHGTVRCIPLDELLQVLEGNNIRDMYTVITAFQTSQTFHNQDPWESEIGNPKKENDKGKDNENEADDEGSEENQQDTSIEAAQHMAQSAAFPRDPVSGLHKLWAQFRLPSILGGSDPPQIITTQICNATGSSIQSIHRQDWVALNVLNIPPRFQTIYGASDSALREVAIAQIRIVKYDQNNSLAALTNWLVESFVITDLPNANLLSGSVMRNYLYFVTAPGSNALFVSTTKNGIVSLLAAV